MLPEDRLRKADFTTGILFVLTAIGILVHASSMPMGGTHGGVDNTWYVSPAAFPLGLGNLLLLAAGGLIWRSLRLQTWKWRKREFIPALAWWREPMVRRFAVIVSLLIGYAACLRFDPLAISHRGFLVLSLDRVPALRFLTEPAGANYFASTVVFMFLFTWTFTPGNLASRVGRRAALLIAVSTAFPLLIAYAFSQHLMVPLP